MLKPMTTVFHNISNPNSIWFSLLKLQRVIMFLPEMSKNHWMVLTETQNRANECV